MRSFSHWTPRYVIDRIAWEAWQRRNPETPWIAPGATRLLDAMLKPTDVGLEWGSGRSTAWFAQRLKHLTSVEHHPEWYQRVKQQLASRGLTNVTYRYCEVDRAEPAKSPYIRIVDEIADGSLTFVLIDGEVREHCVLPVLPKLAPGGLLVIDNIQWYLDHPTTAPGSRVGLGPLNDYWRSFEQQVADWRRVWFSQGVADTAIWFKP